MGRDLTHQSVMTGFGGALLKGELLVEPITVTVRRAELEVFEDEVKKTRKERAIVYFQEDVLPWVPCKTAVECLRQMFGEGEKNMVWSKIYGKRVTLYFDRSVKFGNELTGGIRVAGSPDLEKEVNFTYSPNNRARPQPYVMRRTGDPLVMALQLVGVTAEAFAAELAARPIAKKDGSQIAEIPVDPGLRKALSNWLRGTQGVKWLAEVPRQDASEEGAEGEE